MTGNEAIKPANDVSISVITATYNAAKILPALIDSLRAQTDNNFEWVVADGGSTDGTLALINALSGIRTVVSSQSDFGIYDALNRAIKQSNGDYYIVVGADDLLEPDAVAQFRRCAGEVSADIITAHVLQNGRLITVREPRSWLYGQHAFVSAHSVGSLIKTQLHDEFGYYSSRFPVAADNFFIKRACQGGASVHRASFTSGTFGTKGVSSTDILGSLTENFRVQIETEIKLPQLILFLIRLFKHYLKY